MARSFQPVPFKLKTFNISPGWADTLDLSVIPPLVLGLIGHIIALQFVCRVVPTFTTAPTIFGLQNIVTQMTANNGTENFFDGSFNTLLLNEVLENSGYATPNPDTNSGTGNAFYFERMLAMGPAFMAGQPSDFIFPTAALAGANITFQGGAAALISADCTTYTGSIDVIAWCTGLPGEIRVPPAIERGVIPLNAATALALPATRALYLAAALHAGSRSVVTALTAGQIGDTNWTLATGDTQPVSNAAYQSATQYFNRQGPLSALAGEPRAATDDNAKTVNLGTPTALQAADRVLAPLIAVLPDTRITKAVYLAETAPTARWSGTLAAGLFNFTRINAREGAARAGLGAKALQKLGLGQKDFRVKTISKAEYDGPRADFMPWTIKTA